LLFIVFETSKIGLVCLMFLLSMEKPLFKTRF